MTRSVPQRVEQFGGAVLIGSVVLLAWLLFGDPLALVPRGVDEWLTRNFGESALAVIAVIAVPLLFLALLKAAAATGVGVPFIVVMGVLTLAKLTVKCARGEDISDY